MEIGFGELLVIVVLAVLLLEPKDLPRIAKKRCIWACAAF